MVRVDAAGHSGNADALNLRILGPLEAWRGQERLNLGGPRQRSVEQSAERSLQEHAAAQREWRRRLAEDVSHITDLLTTIQLQDYPHDLAYMELLKQPTFRDQPLKNYQTVPPRSRFEKPLVVAEVVRVLHLRDAYKYTVSVATGTCDGEPSDYRDEERVGPLFLALDGRLWTNATHIEEDIWQAPVGSTKNLHSMHLPDQDWLSSSDLWRIESALHTLKG